MSLWQIAVRNVRQSRGRYLAYLASSAFSVMIYFLYTSLIYHPRLQGGYMGAAAVVTGMQAAAVVIAIFTFLFLLYSNSAFVRSRMKEFGLLSLLGVTKRQLVTIILSESMIIAAAALLMGLGLGLVFLKLFFMAISVLLRLPEQLPFYAGWPVWAHTLGVFGSLFVLVSLASLGSVLRRNIIELVRAGRQPKASPTFSRWKTILGIVLVGGGYAWASVPSMQLIILGIVPVTAMVCIGTVLLLREGSIALLTWLHRREHYFYRPGPFLNVSQLVFKMQDNYRVLAAVSILVAVILTAVGTVFSTYIVITDMSLESYPHALQLSQVGAADSAAEVNRLEAVLQKHGVTGLTRQELVTRNVQLVNRKSEATLVPYSFYTTVNRREGKALPLGQGDQAIRVNPTFTPKPYRQSEPTWDEQVQVDGQSLAVHGITDQAGRILNGANSALYTLVVPDALFNELMSRTPQDKFIHLAVWDGATWKSRPAQAAVDELHTLYPHNGAVISTTLATYQQQMSAGGLVLFIGVFISLVFFAACFSLLYFRLFTESDDDRKYVKRLQQLGVGSGELRRFALIQSMVIFFVPFVIGLIHSTFAMQALGTILARTVLHFGWAVALGYLALYALCYAGVYGFYWRSLNGGSGDGEVLTRAS